MKTGGTAFEFENLEISLDEGCYMTVQELNQLRRKALEEMEQVMLKPYRRIWQPSPDTSVHIDKKTESGFEVSVLVSSKEQAKVAVEFEEISRIYFNYEGNKELVLEISEWFTGQANCFIWRCRIFSERIRMPVSGT